MMKTVITLVSIVTIVLARVDRGQLERPLVVYAYHETANARENILFFIRHGLHGAADFVFVINGESDIDLLIPRYDNIQIVKRPNTCWDLGALGEVLRANYFFLASSYKRFILLNASIRGPFMPSWSNGCWSDMFLDKLNDKVKLIGMTYNCQPRRHVQSMILATDSIGMDIILRGDANGEYGRATFSWNTESMVGLSACAQTKDAAISAELSITSLITSHGYQVNVLTTVAQTNPTYYETCTHGDHCFDKAYFGLTIHPYETIFIKANRDMDLNLITRMTEWHDSINYTSWDKCHVYHV